MFEEKFKGDFQKRRGQDE